MESQFRRGILTACVLATLEKGESYGYKLVTDISELIPITESTLYPILKRLEASKMLSVKKLEHNGRLRKYYVITDEGRAQVTELLNEWKQLVDIYNYLEKERNIRND